MASNAQQSGCGIALTGGTGLDVITAGAGWTGTAGYTGNGWIFVRSMEPEPAGVGRGKGSRAVSLFGPRFTIGGMGGSGAKAGGTAVSMSFSTPGGFGIG